MDDISSESISQLLLLALSILDDVLLLGLADLGVHWQWLEWLPSLILTCMLLQWPAGIEMMLTRVWGLNRVIGSH